MKKTILSTCIIVLWCTGLFAQCMLPMNLNTTEIKRNSAVINWSNTGAIAYQIRIRAANTTNPTTWRYKKVMGPQTSQLMSYLMADTDYEWQIASLCGGGNHSPFSSSQLFRTKAPCPVPNMINFSNIKPGRVTVSVMESSPNGTTGGAEGYKIRYRVAGETTWKYKNITGNMADLTLLMSNTQYEVQAATICGTMHSMFSPSTMVTTAAPCLKPDSARTEYISGTSAELRWNTNGAMSYKVRIRMVGDSIWKYRSSMYSSYWMENLMPLTSYEWQVLSDCGGFVSPFSSLVTFTTTECVLYPYFQSMNNGYTVTFTKYDNNMDSTITHHWTFGDGTESTEANPVHTYDSAGIYMVTVTCTNAMGCKGSITKDIWVEEPNCNPYFSFSNDSGTVSFYPATTADTNMTYHWTFGDSAMSDLMNPTHVYQMDGDYAVTLTTTNSSGCTGTMTKYVHIGPVVCPVAAFDYTVDSMGMYHFKDYTNDPSGYHGRKWNFGDGTGDCCKEEVIHQYMTAGTYTVQLKIEKDGCVDSVQMTINATASGKTTGISTLNKGNVKFSAYPNPFETGLNILYSSNDSRNTEISIINVLGERVFLAPAGSLGNTGNLRIDKELQKGIYFIKMKSGAEESIQRVIKK